MCKVISSDSIIGNFVIESFEKEDFDIEFKKLFDFDNKLSEKLSKHNYYTNFNTEKIVDFSENYPFLVESLTDEKFSIVNNIEDKESFHTMLIRYFRLGMPKVVIDEMKNVSGVIFG